MLEERPDTAHSQQSNGRWRNGNSVGAILAEVQKEVKKVGDFQQHLGMQIGSLGQVLSSQEHLMQMVLASVQALHGQGVQLNGGKNAHVAPSSNGGLRRATIAEGEPSYEFNSPPSHNHYKDSFPVDRWEGINGTSNEPKAKQANQANDSLSLYKESQDGLPGIINNGEYDTRSRNPPTKLQGVAKPKLVQPAPPLIAPKKLHNIHDGTDELPYSEQSTPRQRRGSRSNMANSPLTRSHQKEGLRSEDAELADAIKREIQRTEKENKKGRSSAFEVKEKVRQQLLMPTYNVSMYYHKEGIWQHVARSAWFDNMTLSVIGSNALWLWIDTDYNTSAALLEAHFIFQLIENLFCVYFTLELVVRFMSFRNKLNCIRDAWFCFDSFLVISMVAETWVMTAFIIISGADVGGGQNSGILRLARLLRLSRMARMARLVRAVPELAILIKGMVASMRSVMTTLFLLLIMMYVFAIAFTQLAQGSEVGVELFGVDIFENVGRSMYSLWLYGVLCLDFAELISNDLGFGSAVLYYVFILLAPYTIMNMLIGVLCEVVSAVASTEKEANLLGYARDNLQAIMVAMDENHNGNISKNEFHKLLDCREACLILNDLGIDVAGLLDFADVIFEPDPFAVIEPGTEIDSDEPALVELTFTEFVDLLLQLRGSSHATVKDIVELRKLIRTMFNPAVLNGDQDVCPASYATMACRSS